MKIIKADINGKDIYDAFISGARKIIRDKLYLNKINVFPVADSDTGTNLAMTMNQIILSAECSESADMTLQSIYAAALKGARGNSGMIFTSFFKGLQKHVKGRNTLSMHDFSEALHCSVESAYGSVAVPVEGTMLTVLKDWAASIRRNLPGVFHFGELIEKSLQDARESLIRTKNKLEVLKKANVVDSGGKGIVDFIEGIVEFFRTGQPDTDMQEESATETINKTDGIIDDRYCVEVLFKGDGIDAEKVKNTAGELGSSIVIAGDENTVKLHVHTNAPEKVLQLASENGAVISHKVDDMKRQAEMDTGTYDIALVTDSIADVSKELLDKYMIHMIPLSLFIDGKEYYDKVSVSPASFYDMADKAETFPTSSQPPVSAFEEVFNRLAGRYSSIIGFFISSKLSGTYQNAVNAAEKLKSTGYKIDIIDSRLNSGAQGLVLIKLAEMIHLGRPHEDVAAYADELIKKARIYVSVVDFGYMVRGGRVSPLKGAAAKLMNIKPVISLDPEGKGVAFDKAFSVRATEKKILGIVKDAHEKSRIVSFSVVYSQDRARAERMAERVREITGLEPVCISEISSVVGISSGRGAVAVSFLTDR